MRPKTQLETISRITEIEIGLGESAVVQVEGGQFKGYLIAEGYTVGDLPSDVTLTNTLYVCSQAAEVLIGTVAEVLITGRNGYWFAVDLGTTSIIPCPSLHPYPILFISKHGFHWMEQTIRDSDFERLLDHLAARFEPSDFTTSRAILSDPNSPFARASCISVVHKRKKGMTHYGNDC